ncbi:MAG: energy transducer TonB [Pseudomonadota bacterium]
MRLSKEPAEALLPAKRAFELAEQGLVDNSYTIDDARLLYLLANYAATDFARRAERKLAEQLRTRDDSKLPDTSVSANAWFYLSGEALKREDFSRALISARRTQRAIQSVAKGDQINFARALVFEGISLLNIRNRETKDIVKALDIFLRASKLFASYLEGDEMSSEAFRVEAWRFAADALLASESKARHRRYWDDSETPNAILSAYPREKFFPYNVNCPTDWLNKEAPVYPNEALQEGYVGAAIVSYNFGETGAAENIRIEAEVPKELFSKSIVAAVRKWRIANMVELDKRCQMKRYVGFSFGVGRRAR